MQCRKDAAQRHVPWPVAVAGGQVCGAGGQAGIEWLPGQCAESLHMQAMCQQHSLAAE